MNHNRWTLKPVVLIAFILGGQALANVEVARVNGKPIFSSDMENALAGFNEGQRQSILGDLNSRRQVLQGLIDQEILVKAAERQKMDQDIEFKKAVNQFRRQYLAARLVQKHIAPKLTEATARKYYDSHRYLFSTDQIQVQHILVKDQKLANTLVAQARAPGADFMALAEKYSIDPTAKNNRGDIGIVTRDSPFVQDFKNVAFQTKTGEVSDPVRTDYGFHIIKVIDRKPGRILGYDEVEIKVKEIFKQELVKEYIYGMKRGSKVTVNEQALQRFK